MAEVKQLKFSGGLNTAESSPNLPEDQLTEATGCYYRPGDPDTIHKLSGRSEFGDTGSGERIDGIALCQFDDGSGDKLLALTGGVTIPSMFSGLVGWYTPESLAAQAALPAYSYSDGATVGSGFQWLDTSGNGKHFTRVPGGEIYYRANSINGLAAIETNNSGIMEIIAPQTPYDITGTFTVAVLFRTGSVSGSISFPVTGGAANDAWRSPDAGITSPAYCHFNSGDATTISTGITVGTNALTTHYVDIWRRNGSNRLYFMRDGVDRTLTPTPAQSTATMTVVKLFEMGGETGRSGVGNRLVEIAIFNTFLSDNDTTALSDYLMARAGLATSTKSIYSATPGTTGTFTELITGIGTDADRISAVHHDDKWYLALGAGNNYLLKSDGSYRPVGLVGPTSSLQISSASVAGSTTKPTSASTVNNRYPALLAYENVANAIDPDASFSTFSSVSATSVRYVQPNNLSQIPSRIDVSLEASWSAHGAGTTSGHSIIVREASSPPLASGSSTFSDAGVGLSIGSHSIRIESSIDAGMTYQTFGTFSRDVATQPVEHQMQLSNGTTIADLRVRVTAKSNVAGRVPYTNVEHDWINWSHIVIDVRIQSGGELANFSASNIYYAHTEFIGPDQVESPPSPAVLAVFSGSNIATITRPSIVNADATHWRIYRTPNGGTVPFQLGFVGSASVTETTWTDNFSPPNGPNDQATPSVRLLTVAGEIPVPQDDPPPPLRKLRLFQGSLVGLSASDPRALHYSMPGYPESWPSIYVFLNFPLPEHDKLVDCIEVSGSLIILAEAAVLRIDGLPRVIDGRFSSGSVTKLEGAPGCVGQRAMTTFTIGGESRMAWISPIGIYESNGHTYRHISENLLWTDLEPQDKSRWMLRWDPKRYLLIFGYSSATGLENNRWYALHMHPTQALEDGQPKLTGPHYGAIVDMAGGQVSGRFRLYSAHTSDGSVYLEDNGLVDASNSYDGSGTWPLLLARDRIYAGWQDWRVLGANLRHGDFGSAQSATVTFTMDRDAQDSTASKARTVSLVGQKGTSFDIGLSGERGKLRITHTGAGEGYILDMRAQVMALKKPKP